MDAELQSENARLEAPTKKISWSRAVAVATGTIYVPQLVMCLYTTAFVSCSHCKQGVWIVAPFAPGGFIWEWTRHFLHLPRAAGGVTATGSGGLSVLIVVGLAMGLRRVEQRRWRYALLGTALGVAIFLADAVLRLMRA